MDNDNVDNDNVDNYNVDNDILDNVYDIINHSNIIVLGDFCSKKTSIARILIDYLKTKNIIYQYVSLIDRIKKMIRLCHRDETDIKLIQHIYKSLNKYDNLFWNKCIIKSKYKNSSDNYIFDDIYSNSEFLKINSLKEKNIIIKVIMNNKKKYYKNILILDKPKNINKKLRYLNEINADIVINLDNLKLQNDISFKKDIISLFHDLILEMNIDWNSHENEISHSNYL